MIALEIHDAGLVAVAGGGEIGDPRPGYAFWEGSEPIFGAAARERARQAPRRAHHRFWHALDAETPLPRPFPRDWTAADLAHAQLSGIRGEIESESRSRVVLAVPGSFDPRQLGLLLGICTAAGLPVTGLVDLAVAGATECLSQRAAEAGELRRAIHLDLHLHRTVVTELAVRKGTSGIEVARRGVELVDVGRVALEDAWAQHLAAAFVRSTRFDPLHSANTEQALYERLPTWLQALSADSAETGASGAEAEGALGAPGAPPFTMELGGEERTVEIGREEATAAVSSLYRRILEPVASLAHTQAHTQTGTLTGTQTDTTDPATVVLLSPTATGLPGLVQRLDALGFASVLPLPVGAPGRGALAAWGTILPGATVEAPEPEQPVALPLTLRLPLSKRKAHGSP